jgi:hypothetical protein
MIYRLKYICIVCLALLSGEAAGQSGQVLYYMNLPQNHLMNPALHPTNSVSVGLPVLSGPYLGINNNFFSYSDLFSKSPTSDSVYSFLSSESATDDFLAKVNKKNSFSPQVTIPLISIGFRAVGGLYFFFDINERIEGNVVLPGDIIKLALKGNEAFVGDEIDMSSLRLDMRYYREFGFTVSKDISSRLSVGVRPRLYTGILAARLENRSLGIKVNEDYTHILDADITANFSGPFSVYVGDENNLDSLVFDDSYFEHFSSLTGFQNRGLGLDLGATYKLLNNKVMVSAALTDLGYIRWKRDAANLTAKSQFVFDGLDLTDVISGDKDFEDAGKELLDSLKDSFELTSSTEPFSTWMAPGLTLGGSYNLNKNVSFGILSYSRFIGKQVRESLTLSANVNLSNAFSFSLGYSLQNQRADNLGAGIAFRAGIFQFYLVSDRIPVAWDRLKIDDDSAILLPTNWNTVSLRTGMNLSFGNKVSKKNDKPLIQNEQNF